MRGWEERREEELTGEEGGGGNSGSEVGAGEAEVPEGVVVIGEAWAEMAK